MMAAEDTNTSEWRQHKEIEKRKQEGPVPATHVIDFRSELHDTAWTIPRSAGTDCKMPFSETQQ